MILTDNCITSVSLLNALAKGHSQAAWDRFTSQYSALLRSWALRWGASQSDVDDLVQETMLNVFRSIREFHYDANGSFRTWLKVVAWRSWKFLYHKNQKDLIKTNLIPGSKISALDQLLNPAARDDLLLAFDQMAQAEILEIACAQVRPLFQESSWTAFVLMEFQQMPGELVAAKLGLSLAAVHSAVYRVRKKVIQYATLLDQAN